MIAPSPPSPYESRIRERFTGLVADPIWPAVERLVREDWRDDDETWFAGVQQHCIDLSLRLGLPIGPAECAWGHAWPDRGNVPDGGDCPICVASREEVTRRNAAEKARYAALSHEAKQAYDAMNRIYLCGIRIRDVQ